MKCHKTRACWNLFEASAFRLYRQLQVPKRGASGIPKSPLRALSKLPAGSPGRVSGGGRK
eukprot:1837880-Prorocentrum_lima.AAC.1